MSELSPISIDVCFSLECLPPAGSPHWKKIADATATAAQRAVRSLGIPDDVRVEATVRHVSRPVPGLTIVVGDNQAHASAFMMRMVWLALAPEAAAGSETGDVLRSPIPAEVTPRMICAWKRFAAETTRLLLVDEAGALLVPWGVKLEALRHLAEDIGEEVLAETVCLLLRLGVSLARPGLASSIQSGARSGVSQADIAEHVYAAVRDPEAVVLLHPRDFERLLGVDSARGACRAGAGKSSGETLDDEQLQMLCDGLLYELGVRVPPLRFEPDAHRDPGLVSLRVNDREGPPVALISPETILVSQEPAVLQKDGVSASPMQNPVNGNRWSLVPASQGERLAPTLRTWNPGGQLLIALTILIRRAAPAFIDVDLVDYELGDQARMFPDAVLGALELRSSAFLAALLRRLIEDRASLLDLRAILEGVCAYSFVVADATGSIVLDDRLVVDDEADDGKNDSVGHNARFVRKFCKHHISSRVSGDNFSIAVHLLTTELEYELIEHLRWTLGNATNAQRLSPARTQQIVDAIRAATLSSAGWLRPAILTVSDAAEGLRAALGAFAEDLAIVAYDELIPETSVGTLERISID